MDCNNVIVTIGRQVGSGGRLIGKILAERMGLAFYDREILARAARESGIKDEFFEKADEKNNFMNGITTVFSSAFGTAGNFLSSESLFKFQSDTIRKAATEGGAVFVGRCSDYVLRDFPNRTDVFITANIEDRIKRAAEYFNLSAGDAKIRIANDEQKRAGFYNFFTNKTWGASDSYHLCLNSSYLSLEQCADIIENYIRIKAEKCS